MHLCRHAVSAVPTEPEEGDKPTRAGVTGSDELLNKMGAGKGSWVLCKNRMHSESLSHLFIPIPSHFKNSAYLASFASA